VAQLEISLPAHERGRAKCATPLSVSLPATALRGERVGVRSAVWVAASKPAGAVPIRLANPLCQAHFSSHPSVLAGENRVDPFCVVVTFRPHR